MKDYSRIRTFAGMIIIARLRHRQTNAGIAEMINKPYKYVHQLIGGQLHPTREDWEMICTRLELGDPDYDRYSSTHCGYSKDRMLGRHRKWKSQ